MNCFSKLLRSLTTLIVYVMIGVSQMEAALLVYEGFDGYGATGSPMGTPTPNTNTVGLRQSIEYRFTGWNIADGLTFGSLQTSGGAIQYNLSNQTYLSPQLDLDGNPENFASFTGTLYSSYLVNMSGRGGTNGGVQLRVTDARLESTGQRFFTEADTRLTSVTPSNSAAVGYNTAGASIGWSLDLNTTYLLIGRFTNVGTTLTSENPGVATMYVLTEAQFANLILQPDWELYLDSPSTTIGTDANQIFGRAMSSPITSGSNFTFNDDDYVHFLAVANGVFDEFRFGDSLQSVLPLVPEPGRGILVVYALSLALLRRTRRRQ